MKIGLHKPSPAMVVACVALFVALGGASYAAVTLPRNSVGTPQLKKNAVVSAKVRNGSLQALDFAAGQLQAGPQGLQGQRGEQGLQGDPGRSALQTLESGETIRGVIGGDFVAPAEGDYRVIETFPIPAPVAVPNANVDVDGIGNDETNNRCTGTADAPTAPAGVVCIYPAINTNATGLVGTGAPGPTAGSPYGFGLGWDAAAAGGTTLLASWAYQAP